MSTLELIDVSLEDDSLLPPTSSPPEDKPLNCVLRLSPSVKSVKKTPGARQFPVSELDNQISLFTPKANSEDNASPSNTAFSSLDTPQSGPRLTKSEARTNTFSFIQHLTGNMVKSEEKPPSRPVLLPNRARAVSWSESKSEEGQQGNEAELLQQKQDECQENRQNQDQQPESQSADPSACDKPARRTRSARAMHSLRKSLAWDKAFSTEEGILDGDELPLVAKTPKKLPDLPPLDLPDILAFVSPAVKPVPTTLAQAPRSVPSELTPAVKPISDISEHPPHASSLGTLSVMDPTPDSGNIEALPTTENGNQSYSLNGVRPLNSQNSSSATTSPTQIKALSGIPRPVPVIQFIEEAVEKGTKLRLPSSVIHVHSKMEKVSEDLVKHEMTAKTPKDLEIAARHRKDNEQTLQVKTPKDMHTLTRCRSTSSLIKPPSTSTSISKKVSSVSKKFKDTLGRVLPGSMGGRSSASRKATAEAAHADRLRPATSLLQSSNTGLKVPGSPGPSHLTRSKSARAAITGVPAEANVLKTGVLAELSNKGSSSNASGKIPQGQKKPKGDGIWGSIRGRGGSSSSKGNENVPLNTSISSPPSMKGTGVTPCYKGNPSLHYFEDTHPHASRDLSPQISKASGLRLPSPKIGFFDAGRSAGSHEKPNVTVTDGMAKHGLPPRPPSQHGSTSARFAQPATVDPLVAAVRGYLSSGIPVAPHVTRSSSKAGRKGLIPSASAPASPRKNSEMLSPGTHQAVTGRYLTSRSNFTLVHIGASPEPRKGTPGAARKLTLEDSGNLHKVASQAEEAARNESSSVTTGCGEAVQNAEAIPATSCSSQPAEATVVSGTLTPTAELPAEPSAGETRIENNDEVLSRTMTRLEQSPTPDNTVRATLSVDLTDDLSVLASPLDLKNEYIDQLVESLHDSPSIQSTFWNLQSPNAVPAGDLASNDTQSCNAHGPSARVQTVVHSEYLRVDGEAESGPEVVDKVCECFTSSERHEKISPEHRPISGADHTRRKSIFGWQDMHASLSSPVLNVVRLEENETASLQPECSEESIKTDALSDLSVTIPRPERTLDDNFRVENVDHVRNQEAGQIMNGAVIDDLRVKPFKQESARINKAHCLSSSEKKQETSKFPSTKTPDKEILQSKLENLFESHWSGWPVLEAAATPASSEVFVVSGTPESRQGSDGAEQSADGNSTTFRHITPPLTDADASSDFRNPLAVNTTLVNTGTDGSPLSISPPLRKDRGLLALARSAVSRLTSAASGGSSPRGESSRSLDREGPGSGSFRKSRRQKPIITSKPVDPLDENGSTVSVSPFSDERIRALEAAVEEAILMKRGGAVQHSPPNKSQPPPNPWSPVKKGQHPGPFDCTKKTAANTLA